MESSKQREVNGMAEAIKNLANHLPINKIIAITISGFAARVVSSLCLSNPSLQ